MKFSTILQLENTACVTLSSKKKVLELFSELLNTHYPELTQQAIFESLLAREKMGSTGIGNGVAIPHGKLSEITEPVAAMIKCNEPIPFDSVDNKDVDILFALLVPSDECEQHLTTLSAIADKLSDKALLKQLRKAENNLELYQVITQ